MANGQGNGIKKLLGLEGYVLLRQKLLSGIKNPFQKNYPASSKNVTRAVCIIWD
jgi:hypothetical protein